MRLLYKIILITIILIPITAYLDAILIRDMTFNDYIYVCFWEMIILNIGILIGFKTLEKELKFK